MLNKLAKQVAAWREKQGFQTDWGNIPEKLMLTITELSEASEAFKEKYPLLNSKLMVVVNRLSRAMEAYRHIDLSWKRKRPWENFKEELADAIIRILDITGSMEIDIEAEITKKMIKNNMRPFKHGKQC